LSGKTGPLSGLTQEDQQVMDSLVEAWCIFVSLPDRNPDETNDFRAAIHACQRILAVRSMKRLYPNYWRCTTGEM
jgi:hypothetical protein